MAQDYIRASLAVLRPFWPASILLSIQLSSPIQLEVLDMVVEKYFDRELEKEFQDLIDEIKNWCI